MHLSFLINSSPKYRLDSIVKADSSTISANAGKSVHDKSNLEEPKECPSHQRDEYEGSVWVHVRQQKDEKKDKPVANAHPNTIHPSVFITVSVSEVRAVSDKHLCVHSVIHIKGCVLIKTMC